MAMNKTIICVCVLLWGLIAGCCSCNSKDGNKGINYELAAEMGKKHHDALAMDDAERLCADKINEFAFSLLHQIAKGQDSSFVVAPLSLASAIAILGNGADGEIRESIEQMFGPIANVNSFYKKYLSALPHNEYSDCRLLNYLAVNIGIPINDAFSKTISTSYNACVNNHVLGDTRSVGKINDWFRQQSHDSKFNAIQELNPTSSLCQINTLEFNALWMLFDKNFTFLGDFITDKGDTLKIPIMSNPEGCYPYFRNSEFQAISLPYLGSCYRMLIIMTNTEKLLTFSQSMTNELFIKILNSLDEPVEIDLSLPRFKCESNMSMKALFKKMLPSVFSDRSVGFNAISDDPLNPLAIDEINHKTSIEVNEQGTKAYSVTEESFVTISIKPEFTANHPFLYFVYDEATRAILLMGQFCGDGALFRDGDRPIEE